MLRHTVANRPTKPGGAHAAATVAAMLVTPGFRVDLVAAEPGIHQPIAFAIDVCRSIVELTEKTGLEYTMAETVV